MGSVFYEKAKGFNDSLNFTGNCKVYKMAYDGGCPTIEVESYFNQGIEVYYAPTGESHRWSWKNRNHGWDWANARKQHIAYAQSGGKYARN